MNITTPEDIEPQFEDFFAKLKATTTAKRLRSSNINLQSKITGFIPQSKSIAFFTPLDKKNTAKVPIIPEVNEFAGIIPLELTDKKYGFSGYYVEADPNVGIPKLANRTNHKGNKLTATQVQVLQDKYKILQAPSSTKGVFELRSVIETIADIVNSSIAYEWDKLEETYFSMGLDKDSFYDRKLRYTESEFAYVKGTSGQAGAEIRKLLANMNFESDVQFFHTPYRVNVNNGENAIINDMTTVVDIRNGHWIVINSKNPFYSNNILTKEQIPKFGEFALKRATK